MQITEAQFAELAHCLPTQRGNVSLSNRSILNAILYVAETGCKWRHLPQTFGNWHTVYTRMNRWSKSGVLDRVFEQMQRSQMVRIRLEAAPRHGKVARIPAASGMLKKSGSKALASPRGAGSSRFIWLPRMLERL